MKPYGLNELREMFLSYFESQGHLRMDSFSLIPQNDKSLLLINSGMAPLKPYFTGQEIPPSKRVTTCQKCIRTPDIENVGKTARHGTFFEMLGNFSFGDYFKKDAIKWAWGFLTDKLQIPKDLLYVTVFENDDEAADIWRNEIGLEDRRIVRMGRDDNFWEIGSGPCGPCSEIYVDRGPEYGCGKEDCYVGCSCDRYVEVWNLVFTQFDRDDDGNYNPLAHPNIDTGMGLERLAVFCQGVDNLFEVDTIRYVLDWVSAAAGRRYHESDSSDISMRVIADHMRSAVFMLADGILPSNEGRGYVMRRLLRRALRHARLLGIPSPFLSSVAEKVIEASAPAYPNLKERRDAILRVIDAEEDRFLETVASGMQLLSELIAHSKMEGAAAVTGMDAFRLHDTFGFPLELTEEVAAEEGMSVDREGFQAELKKQKERSRSARHKGAAVGWLDEIAKIAAFAAPTVFVGYTEFEKEARALRLASGGLETASLSEGESGVAFFDATPFYARSGGQVGDTGIAFSDEFRAAVTDTVKIGDRYAHEITVLDGELRTGACATLAIDRSRRQDIQRNHTTTHLLHKALKMALGEHVSQAGSEVSESRLRFDFSHTAKMSPDEIRQVEIIVNESILQCMDVAISEMPISDARKLGATMLFGEKYGEMVRVVQIGGFSAELCGGCHLSNSGFAGTFKILSEGGIAQGVRRIEAVTAWGALEWFKALESRQDELCAALKSPPEQLPRRVAALQAQLK
ncbi:MAG: alanine--tRNA ligase, partial [Eubacteriaceae bacterium]|nr:alanine--tRNA ligase [Eubacteriaceae bacterium]